MSTNINQKPQQIVKPISEDFKKINSEAAVCIMKHKDGKIEKRKL